MNERLHQRLRDEAATRAPLDIIPNAMIQENIAAQQPQNSNSFGRMLATIFKYFPALGPHDADHTDAVFVEILGERLGRSRLAACCASLQGRPPLPGNSLPFASRCFIFVCRSFNSLIWVCNLDCRSRL